MSKLTVNTLLPGKTAKLVASGAIAAGKPVILNSTGTTSQVSETVYAEDLPGGDDQRLDMNIQNSHEIAISPTTGNILMAFRGNQSETGPLSNYGYVVMGVVDGEDITWGTATAFYSNTMHTRPMDVRFDPNNTEYFVVAFTGDYSTYANKQAAIVGKLNESVASSPTFGSFGSILNIQAGYSTSTYITHNQIAFNPNKANTFAFVICKSQPNSMNYICEYDSSSQTITASSSANVFYSSTMANYAGVVWNPNVENELIIHFQLTSSPYYGRVIRGTVNSYSAIADATVTYGTQVVMASNNTDYFSLDFDPNTANSWLAAWHNSNVGPDAEAKAGTLVGDTWTMGTLVKPPDPGSAGAIEARFDPNQAGKILCAMYSHDGNNYRYRLCTATVSGTHTLTWSDDTTVVTTEPGESNVGGSIRLAFFPDDKGKFVVTYVYAYNASNPFDIGAKIGQTAASITNLTAANFLGIADEAIANGATGSISIKGGLATGGLSGLTPGTDYYAQGNATISTTTTSPAVKLGKALSSTAINLEYRS